LSPAGIAAMLWAMSPVWKSFLVAFAAMLIFGVATVFLMAMGGQH
jgi:hypothetical protein